MSPDEIYERSEIIGKEISDIAKVIDTQYWVRTVIMTLALLREALNELEE